MQRRIPQLMEHHDGDAAREDQTDAPLVCDGIQEEIYPASVRGDAERSVLWELKDRSVTAVVRRNGGDTVLLTAHHRRVGRPGGGRRRERWVREPELPR